MNVNRVLFVGGDVERLASVKIRCREIAQRLRCDACYNASSVDDIPAGYDAYFCVKPSFGKEAAKKLSKKGMVIWDVLDDTPPTENIHAHVFSTFSARDAVSPVRSSVVIPHYHCNIERRSHRPRPQDVAYIGSRHWYPAINHIAHSVHFIEGRRREDVVAAYGSTGIALNLRAPVFEAVKHTVPPGCETPQPEMHVRINSGIKLINCLGFGLPSVSSLEPAYVEIAPECTIFSKLDEYHLSVLRLQQDEQLYDDFRSRCLELAEQYHISRILSKYNEFFSML